jgi:hypothetical protein
MKVRRAILAGLAALAFLASPAAFALFDATSIVASGKVGTETRSATGFTSIALSVPGKVELSQGSPASVTVEADDNLLPEIETVVEGGKLRIRFQRNVNIMGKPTLRLRITAPRIDALSISGSGEISTQALATPSLDLSVGGSGDMRLSGLDTETLKVAIAGSGDVKAAGRAAELVGKISGSGDIDAAQLDSRRVNLSIAGSGDATVRAREKLDVSIAGSGDVRYHGDPAITKRIAGSGEVKRLGPAP